MNKKGFTLLELLVTIALIALILGLAVGQISKLTKREMKGNAAKLASTVRYLYNKAASEGVTLRLVMDLGEQKYWVESSSEMFAVAKEGSDSKKSKEEEKEKEKKEGESKLKVSGDEEEKEDLKAKEARFTKVVGGVIKEVKFPKGIFFKDVYVEHQIDRLSEGVAYLYFFPQGYSERAVINLKDSDDKTNFSLEVNPISGSVKIGNTYKEWQKE